MNADKKRIGRIRKKYTELKKFGTTFNAYIVIDHQSFCIVEDTEKKRAEWFRDMAAIALVRMIQKEKGNQ